VAQQADQAVIDGNAGLAQRLFTPLQPLLAIAQQPDRPADEANPPVAERERAAIFGT
jgi:hypothetical protein